MSEIRVRSKKEFVQGLMMEELMRGTSKKEGKTLVTGLGLSAVSGDTTELSNTSDFWAWVESTEDK